MNAGRKYNGESMQIEDLSEELEHLDNKLGSFIEEAEDHFRNGMAAIKQIDTMHSGLAAIRDDTKHLAKLPAIAREMKSMRWIVIIAMGTLSALLILKELRGQEFEMNGLTNWKLKPADRPSDWQRHRPVEEGQGKTGNGDLSR